MKEEIKMKINRWMKNHLEELYSLWLLETFPDEMCDKETHLEAYSSGKYYEEFMSLVEGNL